MAMDFGLKSASSSVVSSRRSLKSSPSSGRCLDGPAYSFLWNFARDSYGNNEDSLCDEASVFLLAEMNRGTESAPVIGQSVIGLINLTACQDSSSTHSRIMSR